MAQQSIVDFVVIASTPPADGKKVPYQLQVGFAQAPKEDEKFAGQWFAISRTVGADGSQRKIMKAGPFETKELAEKTAVLCAADLKAAGLPLEDGFCGKGCGCLGCLVDQWRHDTHSFTRMLQLLGLAVVLASLTSHWPLAWVVRELAAAVLWFATGAVWSSYGLMKRIRNASRKD